LKITTIVAAALAVFYQDLAIIANDALQTEFMSHILAIPFLFAYLDALVVAVHFGEKY